MSLTYGSEVPSIDQLLEWHEQSFKGLGHFRVTVVTELRDAESGKFGVSMEETWVHVGGADRFTSKAYQHIGPDEKLVKLDEPRHLDISYDDFEVRSLDNWDPEEDVQLPLKPGGEDASIFASKKGKIYPRDHSVSHPSTVPALFLFRPDYIHGLGEAIRASSNVSVSASEGEPVLEIDSQIGVLKCTFSPAHGYLIKSSEIYAQGEELLSTIGIDEFVPAGDSLWFPSVAKVSDKTGKVIQRARLTESSFGSSLRREDAIVQFPEGVRVDNPVEKVIHIWGPDGEPKRTFAEFAHFRAWEDQMARENAPPYFGSVPGPVRNIVSAISIR